MQSEDGAGSSPAHERGDGDPDSIRSLATWLRDHLAIALSESACLVEQAIGEARGGWSDPAGREFAELLVNGAPRIGELHDDLIGVAKQLDEYADQLEAAQRKIDRAREMVDDAEHLDVVSGVVYPPTNQPLHTGSDQYDHRPPIDRETLLREMDTFFAVATLVRDARALVIEQDGYLERLATEVSEKRYFIAGDFIAKEGDYVVDTLEPRLVRAIGARADSAAAHYARAARIRDGKHVSALRQLMAAPDQFLGDVDTRLVGAARAGVGGMTWLSRVSKFGGPGLTVLAIGIDLYTGDPLEKVACSTACSLIAAGVVYLPLALAGPPGWATAAILASAGVLGGVGGDWLYSKTAFVPLIVDDNWAWQPG